MFLHDALHGRYFEPWEERISAPRVPELLGHIIPPRIGHLGVLHGRLIVGVADPVLDALSAESVAQVCRMLAAAPYFFIKTCVKTCSVVRSIARFCLDSKIGPGKLPRSRRGGPASRISW